MKISCWLFRVYNALSVIILFHIPYSALCQDKEASYHKIEAEVLFGTGGTVNPQYASPLFKNISYEARLSYDIDSSEKFVLRPFLGYSLISVRSTTGLNRHNDYQSITGGCIADFKKNNWKFGLGLKANRIIRATTVVGGRRAEIDIAEILNKVFYQGGFNINYSISHFSVIGEIWMGISTNEGPYVTPSRFNEYLIGLGYHL